MSQILYLPVRWFAPGATIFKALTPRTLLNTGNEVAGKVYLGKVSEYELAIHSRDIVGSFSSCDFCACWNTVLAARLASLNLRCCCYSSCAGTRLS